MVRDFRLSLLCEPPAITPQNEQATSLPKECLDVRSSRRKRSNRAVQAFVSRHCDGERPGPHRGGTSRARGHTQQARPETLDEERELLSDPLSLTLLRRCAAAVAQLPASLGVHLGERSTLTLTRPELNNAQQSLHTTTLWRAQLRLCNSGDALLRGAPTSSPATAPHPNALLRL